jgi:hypothetical protein
VTVDSVLTWTAVGAGVLGVVVLLAFFLGPFWNDQPESDVVKDHEDTHSNQG